jgi:hypothetical protein
MHPPSKMLVASYEALKDFELEQLLSTLTEWRRSSTTWPSPAAIRVAIEGRPDRDSFDDYMDNYASRGRTGEYADPIGRLVIAELGGSGGFQQMNVLRDREDWKQRWVTAYRKIANEQRAKVSTKPE